MITALQNMLPQIDRWPSEDQEALLKAARSIEAERAGVYHASEAELAAMDHGLDDARAGRAPYEEQTKLMRISWSGPHAWPGFEGQNGLPDLPGHAGVYLLAFDYRDGYLIYAAGLTRRPFRTRFLEHTRRYLSGDYTVLDAAETKNGVRSEIWHGWSWTETKRVEFARRRAEIEDAARRQMAACKVFVADVEREARALERLEAAIMSRLYAEAPPFCDLPDKGMMLAPRRGDEEPIPVLNVSAATLHGLPERLSI